MRDAVQVEFACRLLGERRGVALVEGHARAGRGEASALVEARGVEPGAALLGAGRVAVGVRLERRPAVRDAAALGHAVEHRAGALGQEAAGVLGEGGVNVVLGHGRGDGVDVCGSWSSPR